MGRKNMSRFTEDEVKTIITNVMTLLNEDVFGTIYDFLQYIQKRETHLTVHFHFQKMCALVYLRNVW